MFTNFQYMIVNRQTHKQNSKIKNTNSSYWSNWRESQQRVFITEHRSLKADNYEIIHRCNWWLLLHERHLLMHLVKKTSSNM